jgi:hypothetical protein
VAVHEIAQHPTCGDVVAGTHGRSLWVLNVAALRQMTAEGVSGEPRLYQPASAVYWRPEPRRGSGTRRYVGENPPSDAEIYYSLPKEEERVRLRVTDQAGETVRELDAQTGAGLHRASWDLRHPPDERRAQQGRGRRGRFNRGRLAASGTYKVVLAVGNQTLTQELAVETDPEYPDYRPWLRQGGGEEEEWVLEGEHEWGEPEPHSGEASGGRMGPGS